MTSANAVIAGVGMTAFSRPSQGRAYVDMAAEAVSEALADAGIGAADVQRAYAGYVYGDSTAGQRALYPTGIAGVPIVNVNNNCATGSTALNLAVEAVAQGAADCVLALGFEQMTPGALQTVYADRADPLGLHVEAVDAMGDGTQGPFAARLFGTAGREHMALYGTAPETFARIAVKARRHAAGNPRAVFREALTLEEVRASPAVFAPLTRLQCCPPTSGAAAVVVMSAERARRSGAAGAVAVLAQSLVTDAPGTLESGSARRIVGAEMTRLAAEAVYEAAGVDPREVNVVELHDCFTANELITYEALNLIGDGQAERFVLDGANTYGGDIVTNPSGGLLSKGHPLGATGLAQCAELTWQLRGVAGARQVEGARLALQHNIGLGGACVVTLLGRL